MRDIRALGLRDSAALINSAIPWVLHGRKKE